MDWYQLKLLLLEATGLSRDALHILFGVAAQLLLAAVLRRSLASPLPWLGVLIAEAANEYHDLTGDSFTEKEIWPDSLADLLVTMAIPSALLLLARYAPSMFVRPPRPQPQ
ncbi:MAG TPA: hypothetical protein VF702_08420 [Allosphingosinicella sp.]|jgi:hypothetical protein